MLRLQGALELPIALFILALAIGGGGDALGGTLTPGPAERRYHRPAALGRAAPNRNRPGGSVPDRTAVRPAEPHADLKARVAAAVEGARDEIIDLSHRIHANPEPAFEEHQAATWVAEVLREHGFEVQHPAGSLATAVRATLPGGRGGDGPRIGILAEYDALPGLGHGCGHNTMAASGVGAAIALAAVADELPGEIVFLGTPAEERGSGKQIMIDDGLFDGIDAALLYHPCDRNHVESHPLASEDVDVVFTGLQSHAAADPWKGRNALDAHDHAVQLGRPVAAAAPPERARPRHHPRGRHGRQHHPGPDLGLVHAAQRRPGLLRGDEGPVQRDVRGRRAGAPGTTVEVTVSGGATTMRNNLVLAERFRANMAAYGIDDMGDDPDAGSTDMANVSWVCPTIHPDLAICDEGVPGHSILFRDAAATPRADETTLLAATLVAQTAVELFCDPELVDGRLGGVPRRLNRSGLRKGATIEPGAPRWTLVSNRRRPQRDGFPDAATSRSASARLRRNHVAERPHDPDAAAPDFAAANGWDQPFETFSDYELPTYVGPDDLHEPAVDHRSRRAAPPGGRCRDHRRAVRRRGEPPAGRPVRPARDPRGPVHVGLDQLAPARRRAVRAPQGRRRRRREHRARLDRARPRVHLPQGP